MSTLVALGVSLETDCWYAGDMDSGPLLEQLRNGYEECSVLPLPESLDVWRGEHRTARKRADRARRRDYAAGALERADWALDIHRINTSVSFRQGRPMASGYRHYHEYTPLGDYPCARHAVRVTGVWADNGHVVAYLVVIRAGELALVSQILGHADHLKDEIMYLLFEYALLREIQASPDGVIVYNRHDSGTDGLRWFKERLGFRPMLVEWLA